MASSYVDQGMNFGLLARRPRWPGRSCSGDFVLAAFARHVD
jgi:hypothetical protein